MLSNCLSKRCGLHRICHTPSLGHWSSGMGSPSDLPHPLIRAVRFGCATNSLPYSVKIMNNPNLISVVPLCIHTLNQNHAAQMQRSALIWILTGMHTLSCCATAPNNSDKISFYKKMLCSPIDNHCCNQRPNDA